MGKTVEQAVAVEKTATGLCTNCRFGSDCGFPCRKGGLVIQCEEYECEEVTGRGPWLKPLREVKPPPPLQGLCQNCDLRTTCTLPMHGRLWHCEEYA